MKILIVQTGFLGDVILSTPVIAELARRYPDASLSLLTTPGAASLLQSHPSLEEVLVFDKRGVDSGFSGLLRMAARLRAIGFEKVFSLHKSHRTALLLVLSRIPERYGFNEAALPFFYTHRASRQEYPHEVQRNAAVLKPLGLRPEEFTTKLELTFSEEVTRKAEKLFAQTRAKNIALAPGSVWATKRWTPAGFARLARHFLDKGYGVYLIGGPDDAAAGTEILELVGASEGIANLIGACNLAVSAAVLAKMNLIVSNDSAPLHIASAMQVPVVAVFCATVPEFGFGPWQVPHEVLGVDGLTCRPCGSHGGQTCPTGTHACQLGLEARVVISAAERLLAAADSESCQTAPGTRGGELH